MLKRFPVTVMVAYLTGFCIQFFVVIGQSWQGVPRIGQVLSKAITEGLTWPVRVWDVFV